MVSASANGSQWHSYLLPALAALLVHAVLAFLMAGGFAMQSERKLVQPHKVIQASLVELKPKQKPKQQPRPKPKAVKKPAVKAKPAVVKPPVEKIVNKKAQAEKEKVEARKEKQRQRELQEQRERERLEQMLAEEESELEAAAEFEQVAAYVAAMRAEIGSHWSRPPSARNYMEVLLSIRLLPNGDVISVAVKKGSGDAALDRSAVRAVEKVGRFDMLRGMPGSLFDRHFRSIDIIFRPEDLRL